MDSGWRSTLRDLAGMVLAAFAASLGRGGIFLAGCYRGLSKKSRSSRRSFLAQILSFQPIGDSVDERADVHEHGFLLGWRVQQERNLSFFGPWLQAGLGWRGDYGKRQENKSGGESWE